ncbi:peptidase M23 [Bacterioplanes sanyensis]|uniref:M23 family metallopeptidase n=1 Tax=Bacterioplanes sanyensis TaxID=1249553 RepID=UPI001675506D|nr:M23 family metallopeptidase [Bacterioplanes sanyensis]GGY43984.1 peptidase M23 [Bacterioplanes sanyensis]
MSTLLQKKSFIIGLGLGQFILAAQVSALDLHTFEANAPVNSIPMVERSALISQLSEQQFVDVPTREPFSWQSALQQRAPQWLPHAENLSHWAGVASLNPQLLLALLEANGQQLSSPSSELKPLWGERNEQPLAQQLGEQMLTLSHYFYAFEQDSQRVLSSPYNASTWALWQAFKAAGLPASEQLRAVLDSYQALFPKAFVAEAPAPMTLRQASTPPRDLMQWPWRQGYYWKANGAHSNTGSGYPLSSVDVSYDWPRWGGRTYSVTAAHSGRVTVYSRCNMRITHPSGWQTNYYHMEDIEVSSGDWVDINTRIGTYANDRSTALCQGGSSTGPHLHFSLLYNGRYQSLQGVNLGPYVVNVGNYNYDNNCNRYWLYHQGEQRSYCAWDWLYNPGPAQ